MEIDSQNTDMYESIDDDSVTNQDKIIRERFVQTLRPYILFVIMLMTLLALEIYRWYTQSPPLLGLFVGLFLVALTYTAYRISEYKDHFHFLRLGRKGEPDVSRLLADYSNDRGYTLYKDISFGKAKVDYILVSGAGIFLITIVNWHAPVNNEAIIDYDDEEMLLNGYRPDANLLSVLKQITSKLEDKFSNEIKLPALIKPLIIFPGWFVKSPKESTKVVVMNPRDLMGYLEGNAELLSDNEITLLNYKLSKLIRK
ncbi:MAG: NERD domain-containing protein [Pseudomonadota bacterium]